MDTNFPAPVLKYIIDRCYKANIPLCITPVSSPKVKKLPQDLHGVTWLVANKDETEALSGVTIASENDFLDAARIILKKV